MRQLARLYRWFNNWELHTTQAGHGIGDFVIGEQAEAMSMEYSYRFGTGEG